MLEACEKLRTRSTDRVALWRGARTTGDAAEHLSPVRLDMPHARARGDKDCLDSAVPITNRLPSRRAHQGNSIRERQKRKKQIALSAKLERPVRGFRPQ